MYQIFIRNIFFLAFFLPPFCHVNFSFAVSLFSLLILDLSFFSWSLFYLVQTVKYPINTYNNITTGFLINIKTRLTLIESKKIKSTYHAVVDRGNKINVRNGSERYIYT